MRHCRLPLLLASSTTLFILAACGTAPQGPAPIAREQFHVELGDGLSLDYAIERKVSANHGKACYAFITGALNNKAGRTLSRRSAIDFIVNQNGSMLFRDFTYPLADIPPGRSAQFEMVTSPVHKDGCPAYDRINVSLRKAYLD